MVPGTRDGGRSDSAVVIVGASADPTDLCHGLGRSKRIRSPVTVLFTVVILPGPDIIKRAALDTAHE